MLLPHQLINLIIQISDREVAQTRVLDLADFARDIVQYLANAIFQRMMVWVSFP
jgi:hypothetical protein